MNARFENLPGPLKERAPAEIPGFERFIEGAHSLDYCNSAWWCLTHIYYHLPRFAETVVLFAWLAESWELQECQVLNKFEHPLCVQ